MSASKRWKILFCKGLGRLSSSCKLGQRPRYKKSKVKTKTCNILCLAIFSCCLPLSLRPLPTKHPGCGAGKGNAVVDMDVVSCQVAVKDLHKCHENFVLHRRIHLGRQNAQVQKSSFEVRWFDSCPSCSPGSLYEFCPVACSRRQSYARPRSPLKRVDSPFPFLSSLAQLLPLLLRWAAHLPHLTNHRKKSSGRCSSRCASH